MKFTADSIKEFGVTEDIICPKCGKTVYMNLLRATNGLGVFGVSLYDYNYDLFAICPECGAMYTVDSEIAKKAGKDKSNNYSMVNEKNITYVRTNK